MTVNNRLLQTCYLPSSLLYLLVNFTFVIIHVYLINNIARFLLNDTKAQLERA